MIGLLLALTLTVRLPDRQAAMPLHPHDLTCEASPYPLPPHLVSLIVHYTPRVLCSPWAAGVPGWPECWHPEYLTISVNVAGREGQLVTVLLPIPTGVVWTVSATTRNAAGLESCGSPGLTLVGP